MFHVHAMGQGDPQTPTLVSLGVWGCFLVLPLVASGLVASASPHREGHLKPPPLGVTPIDAVSFWHLCHWNMSLVWGKWLFLWPKQWEI